jgi:hypothetical protein
MHPPPPTAARQRGHFFDESSFQPFCVGALTDQKSGPSPPPLSEIEPTLSESVLLYDWRFTSNQFVLALSPLRIRTRNFFILKLNPCSHSPYFHFFNIKKGYNKLNLQINFHGFPEAFLFTRPDLLIYIYITMVLHHRQSASNRCDLQNNSLRLTSLTVARNGNSV